MRTPSRWQTRNHVAVNSHCHREATLQQTVDTRSGKSTAVAAWLFCCFVTVHSPGLAAARKRSPQHDKHPYQKDAPTPLAAQQLTVDGINNTFAAHSNIGSSGLPGGHADTEAPSVCSFLSAPPWLHVTQTQCMAGTCACNQCTHNAALVGKMQYSSRLWQHTNSPQWTANPCLDGNHTMQPP